METLLWKYRSATHGLPTLSLELLLIKTDHAPQLPLFHRSQIAGLSMRLSVRRKSTMLSLIPFKIDLRVGGFFFFFLDTRMY